MPIAYSQSDEKPFTLSTFRGVVMIMSKKKIALLLTMGSVGKTKGLNILWKKFTWVQLGAIFP